MSYANLFFVLICLTVEGKTSSLQKELTSKISFIQHNVISTQ